MIADLTAKLEAASNSDVGAVVLTGDGRQAFCAGFDLSTAVEGELAVPSRRAAVELLCETIEETDVIVVAALNGDALGVGLEVASACDIRLAREGSLLGLPAVRVGVEYSRAGARRIASVTGPGWFQHLLHTGKLVTANGSLGAGFVTQMLPEWAFMSSVAAIAQDLATVPQSLRAYNKGLAKELRLGLTESPRLDDPDL
jgi:enoyl-CoA hydratase/carnithine racemase